jgi:uncharacterized protein (TIGR03905 family)
LRHSYVPKKVCSKRIDFEIDDDGLVRELSFLGGCDGNLKGLSRLVQGRPALEVADLLGSITCGKKSTSCPAQLSLALRAAMGRKTSKSAKPAKAETAPKAPKKVEPVKPAKAVKHPEPVKPPKPAKTETAPKAPKKVEPVKPAKPAKPAV